jgi:hypothetical protein
VIDRVLRVVDDAKVLCSSDAVVSERSFDGNSERSRRRTYTQIQFGGPPALEVFRRKEVVERVLENRNDVVDERGGRLNVNGGTGEAAESQRARTKSNGMNSSKSQSYTTSGREGE